ncbi:hypothetical protein ACIOHO_40065, partial [Streptomyces sp. NPDC087849]|uniref:hypothetical protein n=1 Tax=Streptomyces sp. NPDC087849 TaxID=3365808 RepID=UPI00382C9A03
RRHHSLEQFPQPVRDQTLHNRHDHRLPIKPNKTTSNSNLLRLEPRVIAHPSGLYLSTSALRLLLRGWPLGDDRSASGGG